MSKYTKKVDSTPNSRRYCQFSPDTDSVLERLLDSFKHTPQVLDSKCYTRNGAGEEYSDRSVDHHLEIERTVHLGGEHYAPTGKIL